MKRLEVIQFLIGDWKSSNNKYVTMTEQIHYVQRKLEMLDEAKIIFFQKRAETLKKEIDELKEMSTTGDHTSDVLMKKQSEMGYKKEEIETLYKNCKQVKFISEQIPSIVDRLEAKSKIHDMAAHILTNIEKMETQ